MKFAQSSPLLFPLSFAAHCLGMFGVSRQHTLRNSVNWSELFDIVCLSNKSHTTATYIHYFGAFAWHCMGHAFQLFWRPCIFFQQLIGVRCAGRQYIFVSNEQVLTYTAHDNIFNSAAWFHQNFQTDLSQMPFNFWLFREFVSNMFE